MNDLAGNVSILTSKSHESGRANETFRVTGAMMVIDIFSRDFPPSKNLFFAVICSPTILVFIELNCGIFFAENAAVD